MSTSASDDKMASALEAFREARQLYEGREFAAARKRMAEYRDTVDYRAFTQWDNRPVSTEPPLWTVVVVSYGTGAELLQCLDSIFHQQNTSFEIVLVNNGSNDSIKPQLNSYPLCYIEPLENLLPSEGRNIGVWATRGEYLAFIDDDGLVPNSYLQQGEQALADPKVIGARGRVLPKKTGGTTNSHYDMGLEPKPASFNLEGNMVIRREVFTKVGGFDPLMFGYEGRELANRCEAAFPGQKIFYWPALELKHDFAQGGRLSEKRARQSLGIDYIEFLLEHARHSPGPSEIIDGERTVTEPGISVVLRAGNSLDSAEAFLKEFSCLNNYRPVEVVVLFSKPDTQHLKLVTRYAGLRATILSSAEKTISDIAEKVRYQTLLMVSTPSEFKTDCLNNTWKTFNRDAKSLGTVPDTDVSNSFLLTQTMASSLKLVRAYATIQEIIATDESLTRSGSQAVDDEAMYHWQIRQDLENYPLDTQIDVLEVELQRKDQKLTDLYEEIELLDKKFDSLSPASPESKALKLTLSKLVEDSNTRLKELKLLHDQLELLRTRKYSINA